MGCLYIVVVSKGSTYSHTIMNTHTKKTQTPKQTNKKKKHMKFYQMEKCRTVAFRQIMIACLYEPVFPRDVQVRSLEAKNRQLELNIAEFCQKSTVVTKNYGGYFSTISDLRAEVPLTLYITQHTEKQTILQCTHTKPRTLPNTRSKHLCRRLKHLSIVLLSQKLLTPINAEVWI